MDVYILLDILLLILIALFIPIGFWRGAYREAFVTLGILFGAALGLFWGDTWGTELAALTRLHESGGAFMVAMLCLIGSTFLIGYSAGAAVPVPPPGWISRTLGALIAGANGALLLSFALRDIRIYLLTGEESDFLDNAVIAPFLSQGTGWVLLISAAVFVPVVLVVAMFGPEAEIDEFYETGEYETYEDEIETYSAPPVDRRPEAPSSNRPAITPVEETRPIPAVPEEQRSSAQSVSTSSPGRARERDQDRPMVFGFRPETSPESRGTSRSEPEHRAAGHDESETDQQRRVTPEQDETVASSQKPEQTDSPAETSPQLEDQPERSADSTDEHQTAVPSSASAERESAAPTEKKPVLPGTCPHCRADIGDAEGYCPNCGRVI